MKYYALNRMSAKTIVDDDVFDLMCAGQYGWVLDRNGYVRGRRRIGVHTETISLHRWIVKCPADKVVDHINGDPSDNRRENLRICSIQENACNRRGDSGRKFPKGVYYKRRNHMQLKKPFSSSISVEGKQRHLGYFATVPEAAAAYDSAAIKHHRAFARINGKVA